MTKTHLLLIDPQNDFCDRTGSLSVAGAMEDMGRVANLIDSMNFDHISVSLDWHQPHDIAHSGWFVDAEGNHPSPFTQITYEDLESGKWRARDKKEQDHTLQYLKSLKESGKYTHVIWPEHCLVGDLGSNIVPCVVDVLNAWSRTGKTIDYIFKGQNPRTEHFSAVKAEVSLTGCPETWTNTKLMNSLYMADTILVAGEASSHCVAATVRDILEHDDRLGKKMKILTDCMSPVPHFKKFEDDFFDEMEHRGVKLTQSDKL